MHHKAEIVIWSDGVTWTAKLGNGEKTVADDLSLLDSRLRELLSEIYKASEGDKVTAFMTFDHSVIPEWIRQYSDHYFNRIVEFKY